MEENFIFTGLGHSTGKHLVTNKDIEEQIKNGTFEGFAEDKVKSSKKYHQYLEKNKNSSPLNYFAEYKMGFTTRNHVSPFPPTKNNLKKSETSLDLVVKAVQNAIDDAQIHPEDIDAWYVSTVSPHEQAPGIASTMKCFFVNFENQTTTTTLASGCSGFNLNLQRAIEYFKYNPKAKHIVVAHTETMSAFLTEKKSFIPFITFGDGAGAVVISRVNSDKKEGLYSIVNHQDMRMIDFVGVSKEGNLYMNDGIIKDRAVINIVKSSKEILELSNKTIDDIDIVIPHQTGNAILHDAASQLDIPFEKLYQETQYKHGNVSGATVLISLSELNQQKRLIPNMSILSASAGVGGKYGAFIYVVPEKITKVNTANNFKFDLQNNTALVTGCTGGLGYNVALSLAKRGCRLILQYNSNESKINELTKDLDVLNVDYYILKSDFSKIEDVKILIETIKNNYKNIDFIIHTSAVTGSLNKASEVSSKELEFVSQINQYAPIEITKKLKDRNINTVLYVGSVAEDSQFPGSSSYVSSKKGLHGFAASFSEEASAVGIRSIYYMLGILDGGMAKELDTKQQKIAMNSIGQEKLLSSIEVAERIVKSLYKPKVLNVRDSYENTLLVRRDGYDING